MSTVLLMTDSWTPTVLRLVPFSQNNAKHTDKKRPGRENGTRGFPVLAVTRTGKVEKTDKMIEDKTSDSRLMSARSDASTRSENCTEPDVAKSEVSITTAHGSTYTSFTYTSEATDEGRVSKRSHSKRYPQKKVPKSHTELNEAIKFPVQDLNEQITSTSSFKSVESANDVKTSTVNVNKLDNTRTKLPKPSLCSSPDVKMCSPVNGVRRSVPLTPGELELKRIRESYALEQAQKRKKYKLNVNQLPRSTTPINDHDPDKLNMKQVIAFLQTKATRDPQKKGKDGKAVQHRNMRTNTKECARVSIRSSNDNDNLPERSQTSAGINHRHTDKNTPGRASVLSTKSTPNLPSEKKHERSANSVSSRSYVERSSTKRAAKFRKPMKEFKLYRFLTVVPDGQYQGLATTVTDAVPNSSEANLIVTKPRINAFEQTEKKEFLRRSYRSTTTANLLHRRAARKNTLTPTSNEDKENESNQTTSIRLPSMTSDDHHGYHEEDRHSPDGEVESDSDTCSTTSATCNSTKISSCKDDRSKYPKKGKSLTFNEDTDSADSKNVLSNVNEPGTEILKNSFTTRMYMNPEFPRVNINGPRHIRVNMPQESRNGYSQEIVRLTLRHEKNATRVTSYMSDMQTDNWPQNVYGKVGDGAGEFAQVRPMDSTLNYSSHKDLYDSPKQIMNSVSNNHFIKVRQKLKSNMYENE